MFDNGRPVRLAYQTPVSSTFLSQRTSHQQPASSALLSEETSTSHQPPANRTFPGFLLCNSAIILNCWSRGWTFIMVPIYFGVGPFTFHNYIYIIYLSNFETIFLA
jgi:hypothetical protein